MVRTNYQFKLVTILHKLIPLLTREIERTNVLDSKGKQSLIDEFNDFVVSYRDMVERTNGKVVLTTDRLKKNKDIAKKFWDKSPYHKNK